MRLSIVSTLYHSAPYLAEFHQRVSAAAKKITDDYEIVLVNDGSPDNSLEVALELRKLDPRLVVVELSRNFGQHKAMMTGLMHCTGDRVFILDSDLEEPPEWLNLYNDAMDQYGADVIYGVQNQRKGGFVEQVSGEIFYRVFNLLASVEIPRNQVAARLMTKSYVAALVAHQERELFIAGVYALTGFRQTGIPVVKGSKGTSSYNMRRRLAHAVNAITSFSNRPLWFIFLLGCVVASGSVVGACILLARALILGDFLVGWPSLILSIWFFGGLNLFALGVLGIYLSKLLTEIKRRPYTIIREVHGAASATPELKQAA